MAERIAKALGSLPLAPEAYETAATEVTGLADFGRPYYREGLAILLASLAREADLRAIGSLMLQRSVILALQRRLYLEEAQKRQPELFAKSLTPPVIITGLPRSGTTFFHRLLAQDPNLRAPGLYELLQPLPLADSAGRRVSRLRLAIELGVFRRMAPGLDARHFTRADEPEECMFAMCQSFRSFMFWSLAPVYRHVSWYSRQARQRKYIEHLATLQALQAADPSRRLVLKAPEHLGAVGAILKLMPEAMIVVCRRDPVAALTSFNSLILATHRATSKSADPQRLARANLNLLGREADRHVIARATHPDRCFDVDCDLIASDPVAAAAAVYRHFGLDLSEAALRNFQSFAAANSPSRHGSHRYRAATFGLRRAAIAARFATYEASRR